MKFWNNLSTRQQTFTMLGVIFLAAAFSYLPLAQQFGFYRDDWYLLYAANSQGIGKFWEIFAIDRPFRAVFVGLSYQLFGNHAPLYTYSAYFIRCLGSLGFYWIVRMAWPRQKAAAGISALLLVVYPGFLDMPNAFDFQTHIWSFSSAIFSIAFTLQAILAQRRWAKTLSFFAAIVTQLFSLFLMEYFIGLEGLRFLLILYLFCRQGGNNLMARLGRATLWGFPYFLVDAGFFYWLTGIFQTGRQATNVGQMLQNVVSSSLLRMGWEPINLLRDILNVVLFSWAVPTYDLVFDLRLKNMLLVLLLAALAGALVWIAGRFGLWDSETIAEEFTRCDLRDMLLLGLGTAIVALLPIHLGDRRVAFDQYSRFSLTASTGAVLMITAAVLWVLSTRLRNGVLTSLVVLAVMIHLGNAFHFVAFTRTINTFWWQVSWRVPQIAPGTVLAASYADQGIAEGYFVWGPANLIYYPTQPASTKTKLNLEAITLEKRDVAAALSYSPFLKEARGYNILPDFKNLLVMSMPAQISCVHVLDQNAGERSDQDPYAITLLADRSNWDRIVVSEALRQPPQDIFGPEPAHTWCYYYEQASLASQIGDWEQVVQLGDEAYSQRLHAYDWIEWMPFVEGYAYLQREDDFDRVSLIIKANDYYHSEACQLVQQIDASTRQKYQEGVIWLQQAFCTPWRK